MTSEPDLTRKADWLVFLREQGETDPDVRVVWDGGVVRATTPPGGTRTPVWCVPTRRGAFGNA